MGKLSVGRARPRRSPRKIASSAALRALRLHWATRAGQLRLGELDELALRDILDCQCGGSLEHARDLLDEIVRRGTHELFRSGLYTRWLELCWWYGLGQPAVVRCIDPHGLHELEQSVWRNATSVRGRRS